MFPFAEVTFINKQKFLIELGRLLTFMSDEDRQEALTLYEKMFDDTDDEQALVQALVSPTRQAVIIARAYDANARKLQAYSNAGRKRAAHEEPEATPDFVMAILQVYEESVPLPVEVEPPPAAAVEEEPEVPEVSPDQFSLFEDDGQPTGDILPEEDEPAPEDGEDEPAAEEDGEAEDAAADDAVESFIADFSIEDDELASGQTRTLAEEEEPDSEAIVLPDPIEQESEEPAPSDGATARRPKIFLLILFVLIAVPLTLAVIVLLLIPTLLSLLLAAGCIVGGCAGVVAAFSGFPVFADVLIVLGCAIIVLALGLLFLWLFLWFVGSVITGFIRSVFRLGRNWCYKEVPA